MTSTGLQRRSLVKENRTLELSLQEIKTTFVSHYTREISLAEVLSLEAMASYGKQATGEKFLIEPHR